mmetsp:Transcript_34132/g.77311  ORF Transcript_34132/g.77311 Transcript_34132/m.77311 type:complete len:337 (-) Transcript_34132:305-1315(-)
MQLLRGTRQEETSVDLQSYMVGCGSHIRDASGCQDLGALQQEAEKNVFCLLSVDLRQLAHLHLSEAVEEVPELLHSIGNTHVAPNSGFSPNLLCQPAGVLPHLDDVAVQLPPSRHLLLPVEGVWLTVRLRVLLDFVKGRFLLGRLRKHHFELRILLVLATRCRAASASAFTLPPISPHTSLLRGGDEQLLHLLEQLEAGRVAPLVGVQLQRLPFESSTHCSGVSTAIGNSQEGPCCTPLKDAQATSRPGFPVPEATDLAAEGLVTRLAPLPLQVGLAADQLVDEHLWIRISKLGSETCPAQGRAAVWCRSLLTIGTIAQASFCLDADGTATEGQGQ